MLTTYNQRRFEEICAPVVLGPCLNMAGRDLAVLPGGVVRVCGCRRTPGGGFENFYRESPDLGFSWREELLPDDHPGALTVSPYSGDYLTLLAWSGRITFDSYQVCLRRFDRSGIYLFRSVSGPDGPFETALAVAGNFLSWRQPLAMVSRKRWIFPCVCSDGDGEPYSLVLFSDDDGRHWERGGRVGNAPPHRAVWPHRGVRWQNGGVEPAVVELPDGTLYMLLRTSQDCHYQCYSTDGGESWGDVEPSPFFGTLTMPGLLRLESGRLLAIWNNTAPLQELDHDLQPELNYSERNGNSEDVFTNRDALHAALSSDGGRTWIGWREIALNELRNAGDFRKTGSRTGCRDKSVHQSQAVEVAPGKILVAYGQNEACARVMMFDVAFLEETSRDDDFMDGLSGWSCHQFLRSPSGNDRGLGGHCAWNRRQGATLVPDPENPFREVLQVARHPDPRLVLEPEGAVWNFPGGRRGVFEAELYVHSSGSGIQLCLTDRFFNPVDPVVGDFARFRFDLVPGQPGLPCDCWCNCRIEYGGGIARLLIDRVEIAGCSEANLAAAPVSYVHFQSRAEKADFAGVLIRRVAAFKLE